MTKKAVRKFRKTAPKREIEKPVEEFTSLRIFLNKLKIFIIKKYGKS